MENLNAIREFMITIFGQVQGIGFRYWVWRKAEAASLTGWVKNNADGTVSLLIQGLENKLQKFITDLKNQFSDEIVKIDQSINQPTKQYSDFTIHY